MIESLISKAVVVSLAILTITSCSVEGDQNSEIDWETIPTYTPELIKSFDSIESFYYSYLGVDSFPTEDGGFMLAIWDPAFLIKTDSARSSITQMTLQGRGPGELLDVGRPTMGKDRIYIYDQFQSKVVIINRSDFSLVEEVVIQPYKEFQGSRVYPEFSDGVVPMVFGQSQFLADKMDDELLVQLNTETGEYGEKMSIIGAKYAPLGDLENGGNGSAVRVPFSDNQLITSIPETQTLLLFDTRTNLLAEINSAFDTLRTLEIRLPQEQLSDSLKVKIEEDMDLMQGEWKYVEPYLPEIKAPASDMAYSEGQIWLKLTIESKKDVWVVLDMEGEILGRVELPVDTYLTHVSEDHLGVRINEINFELYENPLAD